jgi:hypothetical protein
MKKPKSKKNDVQLALQQEAIPEAVKQAKEDVPKEDVPKEDVPKEDVPKEDVPKKARKPNPWIIKCQEVQARPENAGLSYREILKKSKLEYAK